MRSEAVSNCHLDSERAVYRMLTPLYPGEKRSSVEEDLFGEIACPASIAMTTSRFVKSRDLAAQECRQCPANIGVAKRPEGCVRVLRFRHTPTDAERGKNDAR